MTTTPVIVRADGSQTLGIGNITRSLAIAEVFQEQGAEIIYAARDLDPRVKQLVEAMHCTYAPLPARMSVEEDIERTRALIASSGASFCIIDLGNPEATHDVRQYSRCLQGYASAARLIIADDLTRATFPRGVVVNPNTEVTEQDYDTHFAPRFLFGPRYAILRSFYRNAAGTRTFTDGPPGRVAISLGGGAVASTLLDEVIRGVRLALGTKVELEIVTSIAEAGRLETSRILRDFARVSVLSNLPSLREVLQRVDVAVVSGGVTKYEAAATATPMLIVPSIDHQESWGASFARTGAALYGGNVDQISAETLAPICAAVADVAVRRRLGLRGAELVDGHGASRIVEAAAALVRT